MKIFPDIWKFYDLGEGLNNTSNHYVVYMSEKDILKEYWPYWIEKYCKATNTDRQDIKYMGCQKYENLRKSCLADFAVVHWATKTWRFEYIWAYFARFIKNKWIIQVTKNV